MHRPSKKRMRTLGFALDAHELLVARVLLLATITEVSLAAVLVAITARSTCRTPQLLQKHQRRSCSHFALFCFGIDHVCAAEARLSTPLATMKANYSNRSIDCS